jgi:hypothetical protein
MLHALVAAGVALTLAGTPTGAAPRVEGDYIEARTADIYTGPCFSNSEVFITGHQAVLAWKVRRGSWDGVDVSGLSVAAALRGSTTFSKDDPREAQAVLIVDESASDAQRSALLAMARELGGTRLANVVAVKSSLINIFVEDHPSAEPAQGHSMAMPHAPRGTFWAPGLAEISTRPLDGADHLCGNEVVEYPPLSKGVTALPAYTLANTFKAGELGTRWDDRNCRSSFVGHFAY